MDKLAWLVGSFSAEFGKFPRCFQSPGRINLIGEHTDYNEGFVLPAAIDLACYLAISPSSNGKFTIIASDLDDRVEFEDPNTLEKIPHWLKYIIGVIKAFEGRGGKVLPFQAIVSADIPVGAGLSSSAALEAVFAYAFNVLYGAGFSSMQLTEIAKEAENKYVGLQCGIMDMFASIHAKKDHAMLLDCRSLEYQQIPLHMDDHKIVLFDTQIKHDLASSEYNQRKAACEAAVSRFNALGQNVTSLRGISTEILFKHEKEIDPVLFKRAKHVVEENQRVMDFVAAMAEKNWKRAGALMYASHAGLQHDYEVSCDALDFLVDYTFDMKGVTGARMMGGGFGGCTINLVKADALDEVVEKVTKAYRQQYGVDPKCYIANTGDGSSEITPSH